MVNMMCGISYLGCNVFTKVAVNLRQTTAIVGLTVFSNIYPAYSADLEWDISSGDAAVTSGDGVWEQGPGTNDNWTADIGATNQAFIANDNVTFGPTVALSTVTVSGIVQPSSIQFGGDYTLTGGVIGTAGTATSVNLDAGAEVAIHSDLTGDISTVSSVGAELSLTGVLTGNLTTSGIIHLENQITGGLTITVGSVDLSDDLTVVGAVSNSGNLTIGTTHGLSAGSMGNNAGGQLNVDGTLASDVTNAGTLLLSSTGTVDGAVTNNNILTSLGTITGTVINNGTANLAGVVTGNVDHQSGSMMLNGDLNISGAFVSSADMEIGLSQTLTSSSFVNNSGGALTFAGTLSAASINNNGTINASSGANFVNAVTNTGTITTTGTLSFSDDLTNSGTIDMTGNDAVGDIVTIAGALSGSGGRYLVDLDLSGGTGLGQADTVVVTGAATGHIVLDFNIVSGSSFGRQDNDILVFDVNESLGATNNFTFEVLNLPSVAEQVVYSAFQVSNGGDVVIVDQVNPGIGSLSGSVTLTQSLISTIVNRPSSPYVVGLAYEDPQKPCGPGAWARVVAGRANASSATSNGVSSLDSEISASYAGLQFGGDFACFNGLYSGWDLAFGGFGGQNNGSTKQNVFALDANDPSRLTDTLTSVTTGDFDQKYLGVYVTAAKGAFSADLQYRHEQTDFTLNNRAPDGSGFTGLGLTDAKFDTKASTISGSASYAFPLKKEGFAIIPTVGFSYTKTGSETITFDNGSTLTLEDSESKVAFAGVTISKVSYGKSGNTAINKFLTATYYSDLSSDTISVFTKYAQDGSVERVDHLSSGSLGSYQELSIGLNYIKVLDSGRAKAARQFNASVRIDAKFSGTLDSVGVAAQMRWQF